MATEQRHRPTASLTPQSPRGRSVQLHPADVLLAVATGIVIWGIPGAFVAVPRTLARVATADQLWKSDGRMR